MKRFALVALLLLAACESDADKLDRLKSELWEAKLLHEWERKRYDSVEAEWRAAHPFPADSIAQSAWIDSVARHMSPFFDSTKAAETRRDLAERELNRFMSGR